ncbi:MAG TPA: hypothetical protein VNZ52_15185 [Candidatus Thermoplasmatota archaeon]|nr:hypothetical protein [Candidatus Thermoplasmatota archaeon]
MPHRRLHAHGHAARPLMLHERRAAPPTGALARLHHLLGWR